MKLKDPELEVDLFEGLMEDLFDRNKPILFEWAPFVLFEAFMLSNKINASLNICGKTDFCREIVLKKEADNMII